MWAPDNPAEDSLERIIADVLVLGHSLQRHKCKADRVLLVTRDVLRGPASGMLHLFWQIKEVKHIQVSSYMLSRCSDRFRYVFTKLLVLELEQYSKVLLLDSDLLVKSNIDELFEHQAPAAMFRGNSENVPGDVRPRFTYYHRDGETLKGGINGGVVLLTPSRVVLRQMREALLDKHHPCHKPSSAPEQDFLTRWFDTSWRPLLSKYNWQLHQLLYTRSQRELDASRFTMLYDDIRIIHYSSSPKPRDLMFNSCKQNIHNWVEDMISRHGEAQTPDVKRRIVKAVIDWQEDLHL